MITFLPPPEGVPTEPIRHPYAIENKIAAAKFFTLVWSEEVIENPPSRSAKFRYAIKKSDFYNFDTDIENQFRNLIEIENYGDKLWKNLF